MLKFPVQQLKDYIKIIVRDGLVSYLLRVIINSGHMPVQCYEKADLIKSGQTGMISICHLCRQCEI